MPNEELSGPVNILSGAYTARSIIANAQRCLNLYPEKNPQDAEAPVTCYPTPGLTSLGGGDAGPWRQLYFSSQGKLYGVQNANVYYIDPTYVLMLLGTLTTFASYVSMIDNGTHLLITDGSDNGYFVNLDTHAFSEIVSAGFSGSPRVDVVDGYFLLSEPGTPKFYWSENHGTTFDVLDFATKDGAPDPICGVVQIHRNVWLIGTQTTEIWQNVGGAASAFQRVPGAYVEHGCIAVGSIATLGSNVFFLSQDKAGDRLVAMGRDYGVKRVSTPAIEQEFAKYQRVSDAIASTYQILGHNFYFLTFPGPNKTWVYDQREDLWHELCYINNDGVRQRHRANVIQYAYGDHIAGDRGNGLLYKLDPDNYTDNGQPIIRVRSMPHIVKNGRRVTYKRLKANVQGGTAPIGATPLVSLRWSDTRGASWSDPVLQTLGATGEHLTSVQWTRLGLARDRVFELSWSGALFTALNGVYLDAVVRDS